MCFPEPILQRKYMKEFTDLKKAGQYLKKDIALFVRDKERIEHYIPVRIFGMPTFMENDTDKVNIINFFELFCKQNREVWFLCLLALSFDGRTGVSNLSCRYFTKTEQNKLSLAYKELANHNMVYRTKPKVYLVNPKLIAPYKDCIDAVWNDWITLTGRQP